MNYVYINSEPGLYTVGFYDPQGKFIPESDHAESEGAAQRVNYLNGSHGYIETEAELLAALKELGVVFEDDDRTPSIAETVEAYSNARRYLS